MSIHETARRLSRRTSMSLHRAYSTLAKRRRRNHGRTSTEGFKAFVGVEQPAKPYWWQKDSYDC